MTREEHLQFCRKCLNRKFDMQLGVVCKLTDQIADFEDNCSNFELDESVKEQKPPPDQASERSQAEVIAALPEEVLEHLRPHQDLVFAIIGGLSVAIIGAMLWAVITVSTQFQIGYMAVAVGFIVGIGVRYFGAGIDQIFGIVGAIMALIGCLLGNLFTQVGFIAEAESMGYFEILAYLNIDTILAIYSESFSPIDILFYGIAVFEGYKFAFRPITPEILTLSDVTPPFAKLRLPLVILIFIAISFAGYRIAQGASGMKTFHYESGERLSQGELQHGLEEGEWNYWYENGQLQLRGFFTSGTPTGDWQWFDEQGNLVRTGEYNNGLYHGTWVNYYPNGIASDSGAYNLSRRVGPWVLTYENGNPKETGEYNKDKQEGSFEMFYENGKPQANGFYENGSQRGLWKFWYNNGTVSEEIEFLDEDQSRIINVWDSIGQQLVEDGNGTHKTYFKNGELQISGVVTNGNKTGLWTSYLEQGTKVEEGEYKDNQYFVINSWDANGEQSVTDGKGNYQSLHEETLDIFEEGQITGGLRQGTWKSYYPESASLLGEMNYSEGKLNGPYTTYFESGEVYIEGNFIEDKKDAKWQWFFEGGNVESMVTYESDKKQGVQKFWSETGIEAKEEIYEDGELIGENLL